MAIASSSHAVNYMITEWDWLRIQEYAVANDLSSVSEALRHALSDFLDKADIRDRLNSEATISIQVERDRRSRLQNY